eukprot:m.184675 g.184675  ORF g.184675 m.184675 type:complete len:101 (+) comp18488_c0_seq50:150-452(+)
MVALTVDMKATLKVGSLDFALETTSSPCAALTTESWEHILSFDRKKSLELRPPIMAWDKISVCASSNAAIGQRTLNVHVVFRHLIQLTIAPQPKQVLLSH